MERQVTDRFSGTAHTSAEGDDFPNFGQPADPSLEGGQAMAGREGCRHDRSLLFAMLFAGVDFG